ncbi:MAG: outer membrane beta-barrel protein [Tannerellaceae bacterium]|jgi:hypothetical protein|nr:outer membrane beta-barrel protein [Tannerellaceae bacterium]
MRTVLLLLALILHSAFAGAQEVHIQVKDKPLNALLNTLGLEISYDDRLLSNYKLTLSKSFPSARQALPYLLRNTPFRAEKIGDTYVILTRIAESKDSLKAFREEPLSLVFTGRVVDGETQKSLAYATVSLLDPANETRSIGATNENGRFRLVTPVIPSAIKFSFIGYETKTCRMETLKSELGVFELNETALLLQETVIVASTTQERLNKRRYAVSPDMRRGISSVQELLNKIPDVYFDKISNLIYVENNPDILLLIDGMHPSEAYIKTLSPQRIQTIELIRPEGRYISEGYSAIINLIQKENYTGYDLHLSAASAINPAGTNGQDWMAQEQPSLSLTYAGKRMNLYGLYAYNQERWNTPVSKTLAYDDRELSSDWITAYHPNDFYRRDAHSFSGGMNYKLSDKQALSFQGDFISGESMAKYEYFMRQSHSAISIKNTTLNQAVDQALAGTIYYQGQFGNRLHLYGDFSYNYYYNDVISQFDQNDAVNYKDENEYDEYKNQTSFNIDGKYLLSSALFVKAGYAHSWRKYASTASIGRGFLDYKEIRNKLYANASLFPSAKLNINLGMGLEQIHTWNRSSRTSLLRILPYGNISYRPNKQWNIEAGYTSVQFYPNLFQLSPMSIVIDTFLTQVGNPNLRSAVRRRLYADFSWRNKITLIPSLSYTQDDVSEDYLKSGKIYRTFSNFHTQEYNLYASFRQALNPSFIFKGNLTLYYAEIREESFRNALSGHLLNMALNYHHPGQNLELELSYHRNMKKQLLLYGYKMQGRDNWLISITKNIWKEKLSLSLSYIPPLPLGVRKESVKEVHTPIYEERTVLNMNTYDHLLFIRASLRFDNAHIRPAKKKEQTIHLNEREIKNIDRQPQTE